MCLLELLTHSVPYKECINPAQIYKKVSAGIKPKIFEYIDDKEVSELILACIGLREHRPIANTLIDHTFFNEQKEKKNNLPVALTETGKQHKEKFKYKKDKKEENTIKKSVIANKDKLKNYDENEINKESRINNINIDNNNAIIEIDKSISSNFSKNNKDNLFIEEINNEIDKNNFIKKENILKDDNLNIENINKNEELKDN